MFSRSNLLFFLYCLLAMTFALPASAADAASASATATATATASAPAAPAAPAADPAPFGTNLFQGHFSQSSTSKVIQSGDRLILMSDGVYNALTEEELCSALGLPAEQAAEALRRRIQEKNYPTQDNYTAILLEMRPSGQA